MSAPGLGRVKTFSCKRSELDEVATRAIFPDFDYALIAAISGDRITAVALALVLR
jgi:hypothetical protein